ncbi:MAG: DUF4296 domain-containing protein [Dysgonomonas sp.]
MEIQKNNIAIFFFTVALLLTLVSCGHRDVIPEDKMVDVLTDIQLVQSIYMNKSNDFQSSASKDALVAGVFKKHNVTEAKFDSSLVYYSDRVDKLLRINDSVRSRLQTQLLAIEAESNKLQGKKNTSSLPQFIVLDSNNLLYTFDLKGKDVQNLGSNVIWSFRALGVNAKSQLQASIRFIYSDTTITKTQEINKSNLYTLECQHQSELMEIDGYLHIQNPSVYFQTVIYDTTISDRNKSFDRNRPLSIH